VSRSEKRPPKRPLLMSFGLLVAWFLGLRSLQEGWTSIRLVRDPLTIEEVGWPEPVREALLQSMQANAGVALPLAVAQLVLGLVLVTLAGASLFAARLPLRFFLQLLAVSALIAVVGYWLGEPTRRAVISALVHVPDVMDSSELDESSRYAVFRWGFRFSLALHLAALAFSAFALTRRSVRDFLASAAPPPTRS